jgi:hypothetical protein
MLPISLANSNEGAVFLLKSEVLKRTSSFSRSLSIKLSSLVNFLKVNN